MHEKRIKKLHGLYKSYNDISIKMKKWNNYKFGQTIVRYYIFIFETQFFFLLCCQGKTFKKKKKY